MASGSGPAGRASDCDHQVRFVRAPASLWRELTGVTLVRTVDDPEVIELWGTGALLWEALKEPVTLDELAWDLAAVVGAPPDVVARDVHDALTDLLNRGVVERAEE